MDKEINISIIGVFYPFRGGIADLNEKIYCKLKEVNVTTSCLSFKFLYPKFLFPGKSQYSDKKIKNIEVENVIHSLNPFNWIRIGLKVKKQKPDFLIVRYWTPFLAPCLATICFFARNNKTKIISILDNLSPHEKTFIDSILNKIFIRSIDIFICLSKSVKYDLEKITSKKIIYTPHPIYNIFGKKIDKNIARDFLHLEKDGKYILFFGLIRKYKGLSLLLESMADKRLKEKNIKLYIVGEFYEPIELYIEQIKNLSLENRVIIKNDFIPQEDVKYYFSACDITAQTYLSATQSGVTQISYNFNKPVIVSNVGGLPEIVNDKTGYIVDLNPKSIADAIISFFESDTDFEKNIKREKTKYSWDNLIKKILDN